MVLRLWAGCALACICLAGTQLASAEPPAHPRVPGFERFYAVAPDPDDDDPVCGFFPPLQEPGQELSGIPVFRHGAVEPSFDEPHGLFDLHHRQRKSHQKNLST